MVPVGIAVVPDKTLNLFVAVETAPTKTFTLAFVAAVNTTLNCELSIFIGKVIVARTLLAKDEPPEFKKILPASEFP